MNVIACTSLLLGAVLLAACHDEKQVNEAAGVECRERLPAAKPELVSSPAVDGMSYAGFRLGESAYMVERRIAQHEEWIGVSRAECGGVWFVRAGTNLRTECDVHGEKECELLLATMTGTSAVPHALTHLTRAKRFVKQGRPTEAVVSELKAAYGEPIWERAIRRSSGWPRLPEETSFIWTAHTGTTPERPLDSKFQEEVIKQSGPGDYLIVTLLHNEDSRVTSGLTAELRRVGQASGPTKAATQ